MCVEMVPVSSPQEFTCVWCKTVTRCLFYRGFCYFNSVAVAAKLLQQRLNVSKILIVDWVSGRLPSQLWEEHACPLSPQWTAWVSVGP